MVNEINFKILAIQQLLQKPNPLEIEVVTRGFEIRLPVEREESGEKVPRLR